MGEVFDDGTACAVFVVPCAASVDAGPDESIDPALSGTEML